MLAGRFVPVLTTEFLGTTLLFFISVFHFYKERDNISYIIVFLIPAMVIFTLVSSTHISPSRLLIYAGILGIMSFSKLKLGRTLAFALIVIMLVQTVYVGWDNNLHIYNHTTKDEIEMLDWLIQYDPLISHYNIVWDDIGKQTLLIKCPDIYAIDKNFSASSYSKIDFEKYTEYKDLLQKGNLTTIENDTTYTMNLHYVMYTNRFRDNALLMLQTEYGMLYSEQSIKDMWHNSTYWKIIYESEHGKIYEKIG